MRLFVVIALFLIPLLGCQRLVEVQTSQGKMERVAFRTAIDQIDKDIKATKLTDGGSVSINGEGCKYVYRPAKSIDASELNLQVSRLYQEHQQSRPFVVEHIKYIWAMHPSLYIRNKPSHYLDPALKHEATD